MKDSLIKFYGLLLLAVVAIPAQAATVSYYLDQSNENILLPDGNNYLMVTMSDDVAGQVDFSVEILPGAFTAGDNFGIQSFGFNFTGGLSFATEDFIVPDSWSVDLPPPNNQDGFGGFELIVSDGGANRQNPELYFSVLTSGNISNFFELSTGNAGQGNVAFAAHVAGFITSDPNVTSAWFGGSTPVPVPAAVWLFGSGLLGLVGVARRKRSS